MACCSFSQMWVIGMSGSRGPCNSCYRDDYSSSCFLSLLATSVLHISSEEQNKTNPSAKIHPSFPSYISKQTCRDTSLTVKSHHQMSPEVLPAPEGFYNPPEVFDQWQQEWQFSIQIKQAASFFICFQEMVRVWGWWLYFVYTFYMSYPIRSPLCLSCLYRME